MSLQTFCTMFSCFPIIPGQKVLKMLVNYGDLVLVYLLDC